MGEVLPMKGDGGKRKHRLNLGGDLVGALERFSISLLAIGRFGG